jgi:hypothetical protein
MSTNTEYEQLELPFPPHAEEHRYTVWLDNLSDRSKSQPLPDLGSGLTYEEAVEARSLYVTAERLVGKARWEDEARPTGWFGTLSGPDGVEVLTLSLHKETTQ